MCITVFVLSLLALGNTGNAGGAVGGENSSRAEGGDGAAGGEASSRTRGRSSSTGPPPPALSMQLLVHRAKDLMVEILRSLEATRRAEAASGGVDSGGVAPSAKRARVQLGNGCGFASGGVASSGAASSSQNGTRPDDDPRPEGSIVCHIACHLGNGPVSDDSVRQIVLGHMAVFEDDEGSGEENTHESQDPRLPVFEGDEGSREQGEETQDSQAQTVQG